MIPSSPQPFHIGVLLIGIIYFLYLFLGILRWFPKTNKKARDVQHPEKNYIYDEDGVSIS
jgi:hypothetical protein